MTSPLGFFADSATVSTWLSSCGAFNVSENTAGTLASLMDNGVSGTIVEFEGLVTVTTGQIFSVGHDDGLTDYRGPVGDIGPRGLRHPGDGMASAAAVRQSRLQTIRSSSATQHYLRQRAEAHIAALLTNAADGTSGRRERAPPAA